MPKHKDDMTDDESDATEESEEQISDSESQQDDEDTEITDDSESGTVDESSEENTDDAESDIEEYDEQGFRIGDDEDYNSLMKLNEIERESLLYDRVQERKQRMDRREAIQSSKKTSSKKKKTKESEKKKKARGANKKRTRRDALSDLAKRRGKGRNKHQYDDLELDDGDTEDDMEELTDEEMDMDNRGSRRQRNRDHRMTDDDNDRYFKPKQRTEMKLKDAKILQLRRVQMEKLCTEPYLEEYVINMFCRVSVGQRSNGDTSYRCCRITGVEKFKKPYTFGNHRVENALVLQIGKASRVFPFSQLSNSSITEAEFNKWKELQKSAGLISPSAEEILIAKKQKDSLRHNFIYTPELVQELLEKNQSKSTSERLKNVNLAVYKLRLQGELENVQNDPEKMKKLSDQLDEVIQFEKNRDKNLGNAKVQNILRINDKNTQDTINNFRAGFKKELDDEKKGLKKYDASVRNLTRPTPVFSAKKTTPESPKDEAKDHPKLKRKSTMITDMPTDSFDFEDVASNNDDPKTKKIARVATFSFPSDKNNKDSPNIASMLFMKHVHHVDSNIDINAVQMPEFGDIRPPPMKFILTDEQRSTAVSVNDFWDKRGI